MSESTIRRIAEGVGNEVGGRIEAGETFGPAAFWDWNRDLQGRTCAYVSIDATGIGMQGPGGGKADGRMPYVAMVYNPAPKSLEGREDGGGRDGQVRYVAGLASLEALGPALRRQAAQVGMDEAEQWICLSDGGQGLDAFFEVNFPRGQRILDFWHASGHLAEFAKLMHPGDSAAEAAMYEELRGAMRREGGGPLLKRIFDAFPHDRSDAVKDRWRRLLEYVRSNTHRMDYPAYAARGWRIGSGPVEAACKTVVNSRLCQTGMRWREPGADGMCHLRALYCSEPSQWSAYWNRTAGGAIFALAA